MSSEREELLESLRKLGRKHPDWRFGQLVANIAPWRNDGRPRNVWDATDDELLAGAQRLLVGENSPVEEGEKAAS